MTVVLQSASGQQWEIRVTAVRTETRAANVALKFAERTRPAEGWRVLHVL